MTKNIIIFSGKQYAGKDTAAKIMLDIMPNYQRCAVGDIIKLTYGKKHNLTYKQIEANKSQYRAGLIELGNWGRNQDEDYWLKEIIGTDGNIIVTDVRVPHEYEFFKSAGAISVRVEACRNVRMQRGELVGEDDITEVGLDHIKDWDFVIDNNRDYQTLVENVQKIVENIKNMSGRQ